MIVSDKMLWRRERLSLMLGICTTEAEDHDMNRLACNSPSHSQKPAPPAYCTPAIGRDDLLKVDLKELFRTKEYTRGLTAG